jgi:hypothetical protein
MGRSSCISTRVLVALAIGVLTLAQYALAIDLHIDRLLARGQLGPYPGRPAPLTALGLPNLAAAVLRLEVRPAARARPSERFALSNWLIAFTALLGSFATVTLAPQRRSGPSRQPAACKGFQQARATSSGRP